MRRGLVERKRMSSDRRTYRLNLTPAGKKTLTELTRCARRHERNLDRIIGRATASGFMQILKKIAARDRVTRQTTEFRQHRRPAPDAT